MNMKTIIAPDKTVDKGIYTGFERMGNYERSIYGSWNPKEIFKGDTFDRVMKGEKLVVGGMRLSRDDTEGATTINVIPAVMEARIDYPVTFVVEEKGGMPAITEVYYYPYIFAILNDKRDLFDDKIGDLVEAGVLTPEARKLLGF